MDEETKNTNEETTVDQSEKTVETDTTTEQQEEQETATLEELIEQNRELSDMVKQMQALLNDKFLNAGNTDTQQEIDPVEDYLNSEDSVVFRTLKNYGYTEDEINAL